MSVPLAEIVRLTLYILLPTVVVMALLLWGIKRQHDPQILDRKRNREARARRRAQRAREARGDGQPEN